MHELFDARELPAHSALYSSSLHEMMHWPSPSAVGAGLLLLLSAGGAGAGMLTYEFRSPSSSRGGRVSVVFLPPNSPSLAVGGGARRVTAT